MLQKLFLPWRCEDRFSDDADFAAFLKKKIKRMNAERIMLLLLAVLGLMYTYASDNRLGNVIAVIALAIAALLTLMISKSEKKLPTEESKS